MNKYWPDAQIYVFEPEPSMFNQLEKTVEGNSKIKAYQLALSDKAGILEFHKSSGGSDASSSLLKPKEHLSAHPTVYFDDVIKVNVANLDNWCKESNIATIDFMWLDMQGNEINVLKSCPTILSKTCAVYTEVSLIETYEGVVLYPEFKQFMEKNGFKVFIEYLPWKDMGNVLFIRQELI
ncbi:MAG: FkbM family methyltransferase [Crocinitomicaceae bacterium]|nr:FkbM family methyltransferase [Crocinitomicaceae bacterium]